MNAINLEEKLSTFSQHYQPRTVAQFNGHDVMVVKVKGPFTWHKHDETDDFFLVLKGRITIQMREGSVSLGAGEMFVVPRGVEHCPVADDEAHLLLIEPTGTPNTGDSATAARRVVIQSCSSIGQTHIEHVHRNRTCGGNLPVSREVHGRRTTRPRSPTSAGTAHPSRP